MTMDFDGVLSVYVFNSSSTMLIKSQYAGNYAGNVMVTLSMKKEDRVFEIIDRVLKQVFGEEATLLMYKYLESRYFLSQSEFSEKIEVFAKGIEEFLSSGAYAVESKILDNIYSSHAAIRRAELERLPGERDFASQIKIAMQKT